jgi:hypothetical protein
MLTTKNMSIRAKKKSTLLETKSYKAEYTVEEVIKCILPALSMIHLFHLNTKSYIEHEVLGELHGCLYEQVDCLAEQYVAAMGPISNYEGHDYFDDATKLIMYMKDKVKHCKSDDRGISATLDVLYSVLCKALYKLNLK